MTPPSLVLDTDRWLSRPATGIVRPFITLNSRPGTLPEGSARQLRDYLNSIDDESPDGWHAFETTDLLELVTHPLHATGGKALAPADTCTGCSCPGDDCGTRKQYKAAITLLRLMARRGGAVVSMTGACRATRDFGHAFHVWFECSREHRLRRLARWHGWSADEAETALTQTAEKEEDWLMSAFGPRSEGCGLFCHLSLNMDQLGSSPLIPIVGDTVLEWSASRARAPRLAHDLRGESQPMPRSRENVVLSFPKQNP